MKLHEIIAGADVAHGLPISEYMLLMEPLEMERALARRLPATGVEVDEAAGPVQDIARVGVPIALVGRTAIIPVMQLLNKRVRIQGFASSYIGISAAVRAAALDPKVDSILLKIDSPGGFVSGVAEAADDIHAVSKIKHTVAQVDGIAASAAYWLASQANEIIAGRMDKVGSIGVLAVIYDLSKAAEQQGVKAEVFTTGKFKAAGVPGTSLSDEQRKHIQAQVDMTGQAFVADIVRGRGMDAEAVGELADGRIFSAEQAVANGLIDSVGTFAKTLSTLNASTARASRIRNARLQAARSSVENREKGLAS